MEKNLNELEYIEQELKDLRNHLQRSFAVLEALAKIPAQFEELGLSNKQLKQNLDEVKANRAEITQFEAKVNQRLAELETAINSKSTQIKGEVVRLRDELGTADIHLSNYNAELAKQVSEIREEVAKRIKSFWREWTSDEATQTSLNEIIDAKLTAELEAFVQQLGEAGFSTQYFEKQEMLETELRLTQSSLQDVERQLQMMRNFTTVTALVVAITLGLVILQLLSR
jgi:DNA repair exonuclease SbcCD ATPase subunit